MAHVQSAQFQLTVAIADCWKCHKSARVVAPIAPAGSKAIDDEDELPESLELHEATVLMDVQRLSAGLSAHVRGKVPTFRPDVSRTLGYGYWMNHCQHCGAKMGDHFLHMEPTGPFFSMPIGGDIVETIELGEGEIVCAMPHVAPPPRKPKGRRSHGNE